MNWPPNGTRAASARRTAREYHGISRENDNANEQHEQGVASAHLCNTEPPEFGTSQRAFHVAMFMSGVVPEQRFVDRIVAELKVAT